MFYLIKKGIACTIAAALVTLSVPLTVQAQGAEKVPRIGLLHQSSGSALYTSWFRQGLREMGYVEGRNITILRR